MPNAKADRHDEICPLIGGKGRTYEPKKAKRAQAPVKEFPFSNFTLLLNLTAQSHPCVCNYDDARAVEGTKNTRVGVGEIEGKVLLLPQKKNKQTEINCRIHIEPLQII